MFNLIKEKLTRFIVSNKLKNRVLSEQSFSAALKKSGSFLILMPEDEKDFRSCYNVLEYLEHSNKSIKILTRDYRISLLPAKFRSKAMAIGISDLNKIDLPGHKLINKLSEMRFDGVIDLNRMDNLLYSFLTNIVNARVRVGFSKKGSDRYYNFQIANKDTNSENSYNNFLNCLKMF